MDFWAEQIKNKEQLRDSGGIDLGALRDAIEREQSKTFKILKERHNDGQSIDVYLNFDNMEIRDDKSGNVG